MRCVDCRWFNKENEFCMKDGASVFGATIDGECEYADNMTVFDRITASPEVLAKFLVFHNCIYKGRTKYHSAVVGGEFDRYDEAITATVAKLKEVCDD